MVILSESCGFYEAESKLHAVYPNLYTYSSVVVVGCADEEVHGLLACRDISLSRRKDGSPWLLGCGGHGKARNLFSCCTSTCTYPLLHVMQGQVHKGLPCMASVLHQF